MSGIGEDAKNIAVSCPVVDLWIVPVPSTDEAAKDFEIRLPEPGKLIVQYDIPGGMAEATIFLQLHTWDREGWQGVDNRRYPTIKQHSELVLDNMPPGLYEVVRDSGGFLDRRQVTIEPGKTVTTDFIRRTGAPITGRVVGLDRDDVQKAKPNRISLSVYKPGDERNPLAPKFASVGIDPFDKDGKPSDGSFKTEIIPPGEYLVRASVFIKERPERGYRTGIIPPGFEGEATVTVPEQGAPPPVEIQLKKWEYKASENPQPKKDAVDKSKQDAVDVAVKHGIEFLAHQQAEREAAAKAVPDEVTITINPALAAELRALDAMRAGTSTPFDKVDEIGRKLLDRYPKPEEQGQIYYALLQVHGQSGLVTPEHIIEYSEQALKYPLGSRQELMVYIYWGDTLNVRKAEKPWSEQRREAAEVYLKGLKRTWEYHAPEQPPELPDPPPLYDGPEGAEQAARQKAMEHYMALRSKADFIKELIYHRHIFIRQIADMYHRRPATQAEIEALRKQATEILASDAAVARLMAAVTADPTKAAERADDSLTKAAIEGLVVSQATEHSRDEHPWSKAVAGVAARLSFERVREVNGTPIIATYLELRNASDSATPIEIALDPSKIEFTVSDAQVKPVAQAGLPYDGATALPGTLRLPHDSQLRLGVSGNGAGIPKDQGALLDLASSAVWLFQRGDTGEYNLHAKFTIPKTDDHLWHGTIEVPAVRIPLAK